MAEEPKVLARKFLREEIKRHRPPPSQKEIRKRMGWDLMEALRKSPKR